MNSAFDLAMEFIFESEGGLSNDVSDHGGLTKYGISKTAYPNIDIANLTKQQAQAIYKKDYWDALHCDQFSASLGIVLADTSVNCGVSATTKWAQRACNELGSSIPEDGDFGPRTEAAVAKYDATAVIHNVIALRMKRYTDLASRHPEQAKFLKGWMNRVSHLLAYISHIG